MRVVLLSHAATPATRRAGFAVDEAALPGALARAAELAEALPRVDLALRADSRRCAQTAAALGLSTSVAPGLAGCDFGDWTGRTLDQLLASEPEAVARWLADPEATPHGGESIGALINRVGRWLDGLNRPDPSGTTPSRVLALADPSVVRAAVTYAVQAGGRSIWRFEVAPLTRTVLVGEPGRWLLRSLNAQV